VSPGVLQGIRLNETAMHNNLVAIELYNKTMGLLATLYVEKISENIFRAVENELFDCRLTRGTEFETHINKDGQHEIISITKESDFITKRFFLNAQFTESEYRLLGEEIMKHGGFWQLDFGGIGTINLPKDFKPDLDKIFKTFNFNPTFIADD